MPPPGYGPDITIWLTYSIYFTDPAEYAFALAMIDPQFTERGYFNSFMELPPREAATLFGIPYPYPIHNELIPEKTFYFPPDSVPGSYFYRGSFPSYGTLIDDTVSVMYAPAHPENPPLVVPRDMYLRWSGTPMLLNPNVTEEAPDGTPRNAIAQRRWIGGREIWGLGEGANSTASLTGSRDASRTGEGLGWTLRSSSTNEIVYLTTQFRTGLNPPTSWERFYVRVRTFPVTNSIGIWRCKGGPTFPAAGAALSINISGALEAFSITSAGIETAKGTFPLTIDTWYKIDVLLKYTTTVGEDAIIKVFVNGVLAIDFVDTTSGMHQNVYHTNSTLGDWDSSADNFAEIDLDDWICADLPGNCDPVTLDFVDDNFSIDWILGSHVRRHFSRPTDVGTTTVGWAGNKGILVNGLNPGSGFTVIPVLPGTLTSSTSGARITSLTDVLPQSIYDTPAITYGVPAAVVGEQSGNATNTDGTLGYKIAGGADVLATIDQISTPAEHSVMYGPSGMIIPDEIAPWTILREKSANTALDTTKMLETVVEHLGVWGPEDDPLFPYTVDRHFLHNCRYQNTPWAQYTGLSLYSPVFIIGGTYVGNGTYQEITLPGPCHFLHIRAISGSPTGGIKWFGASIDGHIGCTDRVMPGVRLWTDITDAALLGARFSVQGTSIECNQNAIVYQYIAFCDPGMRFSICGAYVHPLTGLSTYPNNLIKPNFLPECAFVQSDKLGSNSSTAGLFYKGPGHTGSNGLSISSGVNVANFGTLATGILNSESGIMLNTAQMNYIVFRTLEPDCAGVMVQAFTYTGNGAASRVIPITPISLRYPVFVLVMPAGSSPVFRDPSHTAATSSNFSTLAAVTNGITAVGIDQITVGINLNVNGTIYHGFAFPGSDLGMLNGVYFNTNCNDAEEIVPTVPIGINILPEGGIQFNGDTGSLMLKDVGGIYTIIPGKTDDTLIDRNPTPAEVDVKIPDPFFKTGYLGG